MHTFDELAMGSRVAGLVAGQLAALRCCCTDLLSQFRRELGTGHAVERRRRFVESERRSVESVYRSVAKSYEGIPDKRTKPARALRPELDRWGERVAAIDHELEGLGTGAVPAMCPTQDAAGRGLGEARSSVDDVLGGQHQPAEVEPLVARYRERWNLAPDEPLIGTSLAGAQAEERRDLLKAVRGLVRAGADDMTLSQSLGGLGVDL